ncbi:nucleotide exchange factor GrpE [Blochmannia endosymbiont of Colobopsis nipponica]|uniref:nucleotide exchange factor GrpE n=1 Tax=Blochmannia endosymbiont of Colobopsis nipponica TaxID=2681987 RepID=UPI0017847513|nr:nucleotide exchange factor GrpE [Blochmannia endosymbiont of Colobopsis nipponica]QOI11343.1 nucleotide exchange factor GrpE [Blochmannia endosymbiont of Colobopsis nipponica]
MMNNKDQNVLDDLDLQKNDIEKDNKNMIESCKSTDDILDLQKEKIINLKKELLQIQEREHDSLLRAQAEIENIRRRSEQNIEKAHKFALEFFISELLPVIDNLERTLEMLDKSNDSLAAIIKGIQLTYKSFLDVMYKFGIKIIDDVNVPFDPELHQAMSISESDKFDSNKVITVIQKGYRLHERLIRPAMVIVSK